MVYVRWFLVVLLMVMIFLVPTAQAKDNQDPETCERRDICWEGQPCICDYPWLFTLAFGVISVDVACEDGLPKVEQLVQIRREYLGLEREKITNDKGNVKFVAGVGKYVVMVEGEEQSVNVYGMLATKNLNFGAICFTTTTTTTSVLPQTTTTTVLPTTTVIITTSTTTIAGVPHTTTSYRPGRDNGRPTTTIAPATTSVTEETTSTVEPTTTTTAKSCEEICSEECQINSSRISINCVTTTIISDTSTTTSISCYDECVERCQEG
jgi:hypothetical protein